MGDRRAADSAVDRAPPGGGSRHVEDRAVFTAVIYALTAGWAWRHLPAEFGVSQATAHRRCVAWTEAGPGPRQSQNRGLDLR